MLIARGLVSVMIGDHEEEYKGLCEAFSSVSTHTIGHDDKKGFTFIMSECGYERVARDFDIGPAKS